MKIWNYEINLQKYGCSSTVFSLKGNIVEHRMKWIIWINATREWTPFANRLERNATHQTAVVMKRKHIFHHRNGRTRNDTDVSWNLAKVLFVVKKYCLAKFVIHSLNACVHWIANYENSLHSLNACVHWISNHENSFLLFYSLFKNIQFVVKNKKYSMLSVTYFSSCWKNCAICRIRWWRVLPP